MWKKNKFCTLGVPRQREEKKTIVPPTYRPASVELKVQGVRTVFAIAGARLQKKSAYR
jgi:hypothetical protein